MPTFRTNDRQEEHLEDRHLTREEIESKHEAAFKANAIISWKSPVRVFKARSRKYFVKVGLYGLIFTLAAIFFEEYVLVGVIWAVLFVVYVLASAAPDNIDHKIISSGIVSGGKAFLWEELDSFWFETKGDDRLLVVETYMHFPRRLLIILSPSVSERAIHEILKDHIHYHHAPVHTLLDKWATFLQQRINLE